MTISPDDALMLTEEQITVIAEVQAEIDLHLANNYSDGKQIDIRHSIIAPLFQYDQKVLLALVNSYELSGWTVVRYANDRQGDWLSFSRT